MTRKPSDSVALRRIPPCVAIRSRIFRVTFAAHERKGMFAVDSHYAITLIAAAGPFTVAAIRASFA